MKRLLTLLLLAVFGCQTATDPVLPDQPKSEDSHFISAAQAAKFAQTAIAPQSNPNARAKAKTIKSQLIIDDANDSTRKGAVQPVFYICNYEEGGYSIISADDRLQPVLAMVESGPNISRDAELPGGILSWMKSTKDQIQTIRKVKLTKKAVKSARTTTLISEKLPLLRTRWSQARGRYAPGWPTFNRQIPYSCPGTSPAYQDGNALVGCVGLSVAQIVRYWGMRNPSYRTQYQYNWSAMPADDYHTDVPWEATRGFDGTGREVIDGKYATDEIARLMADAAREVHTSYGCEASGATGTTRVAVAFKQYFGYADATYSSTYRPHDVVANLNMEWPVILRGFTNSFMGWGTGSGHEWVCDGYRTYQDQGAEYCYYDEYGSYMCDTPYYYRVELHMNWGWGGSHNGWFSSTYFGADVNGRQMPYNYNSDLGAILSIHP